MRNLEEFNGKHLGQPGIVIGSGTSVLDVDLSLFKNYPRITVNSGYMACTDAEYFVSDDEEISLWNFFCNDLRNSNTIVFLYEDKLQDRVEWFGDRSVLFRHRQGYHITDKYEHENKKNRIVQCRSSLGSAIHIAIIMGCDPILVVGLDCYRWNSYRWFWQHPSWQGIRPYRIDRHKEDKYRQKYHRRVKTDDDLVDIMRYWQAQGGEFNKKCRVYNCSKDSLVDVFPKISAMDFVDKFNSAKE